MVLICRFQKKITEKENGFCVAVYRMIDDKGGLTKEFFTAFGTPLPLSQKPGTDIHLKGEWIDKPKYGKQFSVSAFLEKIRPTKEAAVSYLASLVKGVGKRSVEKLFDAFGPNLFEVIEHEPTRLAPFLNADHCEKLVEAYKRTKVERDLIEFLQPHGISSGVARQLMKKVGSDALNVIKSDPYRLCNLRGIGFKSADEIAHAAGYDLAAKPRVAQGILHVLKTAQSGGHLYLTRQRLATKTLELLQESSRTEELTEDKIHGVLEDMIDKQLFRQRTKSQDLIYTMKAYQAERDVAISAMRLLVRGKQPHINSLEGIIKDAEKKFNIVYAEKQLQAVLTAFTYNFSVIAGYPGTGKTTVVNALVYVQKVVKRDSVIYLCSPTGRAARRLEQATGHSAATIHKMLGLTGESPEEPTNDITNADLIIVDEVSMLDIFLARTLFCEIKSGTRVVFVGDPDQLPSVGPGAVLHELIQSRCVPVTYLDAIYRQGKQSLIAFNAKAMREGRVDFQTGSDFAMIEVRSSEQAAAVIKDIYQRALMSGVNLDELEVLSPRRKKHPLSAETLNLMLRDRINPPGEEKKEVQVGLLLFREGDKVMQTENTDEVSNGDIGYIKNIFTGKETQILIDFEGHRRLVYSVESMRKVQLAYAMSVHKSQGSEFEVVIFNLMDDLFRDLKKRNLAYTAVTRAKKILVFVGNRSALADAIRNPDTERRNTALAVRIRGFYRAWKRQQETKSA